MRSFVEAQGVHVAMVPEMVGTTRLGPADVVALARIRRLIRGGPDPTSASGAPR